MPTKSLFFVLLLTGIPSVALAFPAPEAMGAISFALSSLWAHLSAIFGSFLGIRASKNQSHDSLKRFFVALLFLFLMSLSVNIMQAHVSARDAGVTNEVNFQKVQPVSYPIVKREFHANELDYRLKMDGYLARINDYQLIPVVTQQMHQSESLQSFGGSSHTALIIDAEGQALKLPDYDDQLIPVLMDWNNDLSRIAINSLIKKSQTANFLWLEGGYQSLINTLANDKFDAFDYVDVHSLHDYQDNKNAFFVDVTEKHAYDERGYFYPAINLPYSQIFSEDLSILDGLDNNIPIVFLDFYESKSRAVANWYHLKTGRTGYVLDGGYEKLTAEGLDWVPFYPNQYRLLSPSQVYDWYIGSEDVLFLDGRSSEQYQSSEEKWIARSTPIEYTDLQELYAKVDALDKTKRYAGFVYDQGNAFKTLVLGHALYERGYTWLGLYTRPQHLSYAEIDDFTRNRPYRIEKWQRFVRLKEAYPKYLSSLYQWSELPGWLFMMVYGLAFRLLLLPITAWTSQPVFMKKPLQSWFKIGSNILFITILIVFAVFVQSWMHDFGDLHWSTTPYLNLHLLDKDIALVFLATGLIGIQLLVTPGLRILSSWGKQVFGVLSLIVIGYFLSGLTNGLLLYIGGITLGSIALSAFESLIRHVRKPGHSDDLPVLKSSEGTSIVLPCASEVNACDYGIKAGRLGEAYQSSYPVPRFFVLTSQAMDALDRPDNRKKLFKSAKRLGGKVIVRSAALTEDSSVVKIGRLESKVIDLTSVTINEFSDIVLGLAKNQNELPSDHRQLIIQAFVQAEFYCVGVSRDIDQPEHSRIEYGSHESVTEGGEIGTHLISDSEADRGPFSAMHGCLRRLESHYKESIDAELALTKSGFNLLQVRPHHAFDLCSPVASETLKNDLNKVPEPNEMIQIHEAGECPNTLSISILESLYGKSLVTVSGIPYLKSKGKRQKLLTYNQYLISFKLTANEVRSAYETIRSISPSSLSDDVLVEHCQKSVDLLKATMDLSTQLRVSKRLQKKIALNDRDGMGYWSEDQTNLDNPCHHPSVFLSNADFNVNSDRIKPEKMTLKAIPPLTSKIDKATRVLTDLHYLTARVYTGLSMLIHEIDRRIQGRFNRPQGSIYGATLAEVISLQWGTPKLWEARIKALATRQHEALDAPPGQAFKHLDKRLKAVIFHVDAETNLEEIPENALLIMENGRSDIIHKMDIIKGIICRNGGENSHWMMVARSLGIYAVSGARDLKTGEWAHEAPVTLMC